MFTSPEHAWAAAFTMIELPIEPKNATQLVVEALRERFGVEQIRLPTGLTPHDWHAQAVMTLAFTRRTLGDGPLWDAVEAEYCTGVRGALAIQRVSEALAPGLTGDGRLLPDLLVMRAFRRTPSIRMIADQFDMAVMTVARRERPYREQVNDLRHRAVQAAAGPMVRAGLVLEAQHA